MIHLGVLPKVGIDPSLVDGAAIRDFVRGIEAAGAESVWVVEHVVVPETYDSVYPYAPEGKMGLPPTTDLPDPLTWLSYAAAHTTRLRLGTAMLILPEHQPLVLAKRLATLDRISGGRLLAGVGIGWLREEYDALGVPWARRGARADEYLAAMRALWTHGPASFEGAYVHFRDVHLRPRPSSPEGVPVLVGGHSVAAARRAGRYGSGLFPLGVDIERIGHLDRAMRRSAEEAGRDPDLLTMTAIAPRTVAEVDQFRGLGVHRVVMNTAPNAERAAEQVARYRDEILGA